MPDTIGQLVAKLAQTNCELWHEEDKARANDYADAKECKQRIDVLNQQRNDLIEAIDVAMGEKARFQTDPTEWRGVASIPTEVRDG